DEVGPADRDRLVLPADLLRRAEVGVVGERRVAAGPRHELDAALDVEPVVVPAHGVEDLLAPHALVPGDGVGVGVGADVARVQRARHGRRRRVDREDLVARLRAVEPVGALVGPALAPLGLEALEAGLVGDAAHVPEATGGARPARKPFAGAGPGCFRSPPRWVRLTPRVSGGHPMERPLDEDRLAWIFGSSRSGSTWLL